jgi:hypothetical protein
VFGSEAKEVGDGGRVDVDVDVEGWCGSIFFLTTLRVRVTFLAR